MTESVEHVYLPSDLPALCDALSRWTEAAGSCGDYHLGDLCHWVNELLGERAIDAGCVRFWTRDSTIVGLAVCGLFGRAFQVLVHPDLRGGAAERAWLSRAESVTLSWIATQQGVDVSSGPITDVFDCDEVRRASLEGLGYSAYRVWDHVNERPLAEAVPDVELRSGFSIRATTPVEARSLTQLGSVIFGGTGAVESMHADTAGPVGPASEWPRTLVVVAPDGQLAGMVTIYLDRRNRVGLFEPVGVHPRFRRLGLARAAMAQGLREMAAAGMRVARVCHDATNVGAAGLYRSLGFEKRHTTLGYRRRDADDVSPVEEGAR